MSEVGVGWSLPTRFRLNLAVTTIQCNFIVLIYKYCIYQILLNVSAHSSFAKFSFCKYQRLYKLMRKKVQSYS